jgi:hypothetical protein
MSVIAPEARKERGLTQGEISILKSVFGRAIPFDEVRVYDKPFLRIFPKDRAMAPNGHLYFPYALFAEDFSAPGMPLRRKAVFVHEGTHLYQHYVLKWNVMARGPFNREYEYRLLRGKTFQQYGLEQMGMIAQHYYTLRENGTLPPKYPYQLSDYLPLLPIGQVDASGGLRA